MTSETKRPWTKEGLLTLGRSYQPAAIVAAAAELEVFDALCGASKTAKQTARHIGCDARALTVLLDALVALRLLRKSHHVYRLRRSLAPFLTSRGKATVLAMAQHQANCLRRWSELARVVKTGRPANAKPSVRGAAGDTASFIGAMDNISGPVAAQIIQAAHPLKFRHLLDVGGASGTWTIAFLNARPKARATLFDLPPVIPLARRRLGAAGLRGRVKFVSGDFMRDRLPSGADLAWVSAIVHQNSRAQNRKLFRSVFRSLVPGGRIALRDILMQPDHTRPVAGALFAINMLVATAGGGTFTFAELREDLESVGFTNPTAMRRDEGMNSIIIATKPQS